MDDLYRWDQALYTDTLLPRPLLEVMAAPRFTYPDLPDINSYGYGWFSGTIDHRPAVAHGGAIEGFSAYLLRYPVEKATIILLSNQETTRTEELARKVSDNLLNTCMAA